MVEAAVSLAVTSTYPMCEVKVVYGTHAAFRASVKDVLPTHQKSNVIYLFRCRCGGQYMGKTTQRLENRIKQHLPSSSTLTHANKKSTKNSSAIYEHLCKNPDCFNKYDKSLFNVVCKAHTGSVLHVLEALYIRSLKPDLCKQMEYVKCLQLFRNPQHTPPTHTLTPPHPPNFTHAHISHSISCTCGCPSSHLYFSLVCFTLCPYILFHFSLSLCTCMVAGH